MLKKYSNDLNEINDKIIAEIKSILDEDEKYIQIVEKNIGPELNNTIEKEIKKIDLKKHISAHLEKEKLIEKFEKNVDSLNFLLMGNSEEDKRTFIKELLGLSQDKDTYNNDDYLGNPNIIKFEKYNNDSKKGIQIFSSRGTEPNEYYNMENCMENIANYFNKEILPNNTNFIYGFIYLGYSD